MPFFSGFAGKFGEELARSRSEEADRAERQNALESSVLQHLTQSPDPEIASHAITGLLDLASPQRKAKGLAGWLGKVAEHPAMPTIRQLIQQGREVPDQPGRPPQLQVEGGIRAGATPGEAVPLPGASSASQASPVGPAAVPPPVDAALAGAPAGAVPMAATPPPALAPFAPGAGYQPPTTKRVPREVMLTPEAQAQRTAEAHERGTLNARGAAYDQFKGDPQKQQIIPGVDNPPAPRAGGEWQDPDSKQWYRQDITLGPSGERLVTRTPISKVAPRPTGPEGQAMERALEIQATTPGLTNEQALEVARAEGRKATLAKVQAVADTHTVRLGQIAAMVPATISAWQRVNGTVPMTRAQATQEAYRALSTARLTLGGGPDVTTEDITRFADGLLNASAGRRGAVVSPTRAAMSQPLTVDGGAAAQPGTPGQAPGSGGVAATPPPTLTGAVPADLAGTNPHPRQLTQGQIEERTTAQQIIQLGKEVLKEGDELGWAGVGGMGAGTVGGFLDSTFGDMAGPKAQEAIAAKTSLRNKINRIFGIIGQLQGGRTFTGTELQIIKGYAPTINQSIPALKSNLAALTSYVEQRLSLNQQNLEQPGKPGGPPPPPSGVGGGAAGAAAPAPAAPAAAGGVPPEVAAILKGQPPKRYTLTDGSVWVVDASGAIRKGG